MSGVSCLDLDLFSMTLVQFLGSLCELLFGGHLKKHFEVLTCEVKTPVLFSFLSEIS